MSHARRAGYLDGMEGWTLIPGTGYLGRTGDGRDLMNVWECDRCGKRVSTIKRTLAETFLMDDHTLKECDAEVLSRVMGS